MSNLYIYRRLFFFLFFFNDTATTEIYTLSLHDALPIFDERRLNPRQHRVHRAEVDVTHHAAGVGTIHQEVNKAVVLRSEEHTSELQSQSNLVCRLLLEKKKKTKQRHRKGTNTRTLIHPT